MDPLLLDLGFQAQAMSSKRLDQTSGLARHGCFSGLVLAV
jgi:hypothetical protein